MQKCWWEKHFIIFKQKIELCMDPSRSTKWRGVNQIRQDTRTR